MWLTYVPNINALVDFIPFFSDMIMTETGLQTKQTTTMATEYRMMWITAD